MTDFSGYNDLMLLQEIKKGSKPAFNALFHKYSRFLKLEAYHRLRDTELAEEVVNDVFNNIWMTRLDLHINFSFKQYLFKSVKNRCVCRKRSMKSHKNVMNHVKEIETETDHGFDPGIMENKELGQQIMDAIAHIGNPRSKRAFELQFIHDKSHREIAELMNLNPANVRQMISRALKIVRPLLKKYW